MGITNALENPTGQDSFSGIGYAIPASTLQKYMPDMLAGKTVSHAKLGVSLVDLTPSIVSDLNISTDKGVMIGSVEPGSAAANAGLRAATRTTAGDVIVAIDGHTVNSYEDLANYLDTVNPGDQITLKIVRGTQQTDVPIVVDAWTTSVANSRLALVWLDAKNAASRRRVLLMLSGAGYWASAKRRYSATTQPARPSTCHHL